jgi:integrase
LNLAEGIELKKTGKITDPLSIHTNPLKWHPDGSIEYDPSNPAEAEEARRLRAESASLYKQGATLQEAINATRHAPALPSITPIASTAGATLKDCLEQHLAEEGRRGHVAKTMSEKKSVFADFLGFFGDIPINDITREQIGMRDGWRDREYKVPNGKNKDKKRSGVTLEKRRGYLSKFFEWAHESGKYHRENPMRQKMATKAEIGDARTKWAKFSTEEIGKLFAPSYVQEMDKPDFYWLPLMALFTGARLGELGRLELSTFEEVDGVKCFRIEEGKTVGSKRRVPIHSQLLALRLWEYAQKLKCKGEIFLIPHRPQDPAGTPKDERKKDPEKMTGRKWGLWVEKCSITEKNKVFHSFRSTVVSHRKGKADSTFIKKGVGHSTPENSDVHNETYVQGEFLFEVQKTIEAIKHPQVNFEALRLKDPTFSAFFAIDEAKKKEPKAIERAERLARHSKAQAEREERNRDKRKKSI